MKQRLLIVALLACSTAQASKWVDIPVPKGAEQIDVDSIKVDGDVRSAWIRVTFVPQTLKGIGDQPEKWVSGGRSLTEYNCKEETSRITSSTTYYEDGEEYVANIRDPEWAPIPPGRTFKLEMLIVCHLKR